MNLPTRSPIEPNRTGRERGGDGGGKVVKRGETAGPAGVGEENKNLPHPLLSDLLRGGGLAMSGPLWTSCPALSLVAPHALVYSDQLRCDLLHHNKRC